MELVEVTIHSHKAFPLSHFQGKNMRYYVAFLRFMKKPSFGTNTYKFTSTLYKYVFRTGFSALS